MASLLPARLDAAPPLMNHQGVLTTAGGAPLADGAYDLTFALYASAAASAPLWTETVSGVAVQGGFHSAVIGAATPFPAGLFRDHAELWLGVRVGTGAELPRARLLAVAYALESDHALAATTATSAGSLDCLGCVAESALGFDLDAAVAAGATAACYDSPAELRAALDAAYAPLAHDHAGMYSPVSHDHGGTYSPLAHGHAGAYSPFGHSHPLETHTHPGADVTSPVAEAQHAAQATLAAEALLAANAQALGGSSLAQVIQAAIDATLAQVAAAGYLKRADRLDPAQLPPNGLDEVSNGLLTNQFQDTIAAPSMPVPIPDQNPNGVASTLSFPDVGTAEGLTVTVDLVNSDVSGITVRLADPDGGAYLLYDRGASGTALTATYPTPTPTLSGNLSTWVGRNPKGTWKLTVVDSKYLNNLFDGQISGWSITTKTLSTKKTKLDGDLVVTGSGTFGGRLDVAGDAALGGTVSASAVVVGGRDVSSELDGLKAVDADLRARVDACQRSQVFGDGSDGDATITGTVTLTRNMYYRNLTVSPGAVLQPAGWMIFVADTFRNDGTLRRSGGNGATPPDPGGYCRSGKPGGGGGTGDTGGFLPAIVRGGDGGGGGSDGSPGGAGGAGTAAAAGLLAVNGASGGSGGSGGYGGGGGGSGGATTRATVGRLDQPTVLTLLNMVDYGALAKLQTAGSSGGGGGGSGATAGNQRGGGGGGGGGANGGLVVVVARKIAAVGTIEATGGKGGNGSDAHSCSANLNAGGGGGGGGGHGGVVVLGYASLVGGDGTIVVTGGAGGNGGSNGGNGGNGGAGSGGQTGAIGRLIKVDLGYLFPP